MKAIVVKQFGKLDVMKLEEIQDLSPGEGEVLVKVHAVGINPVETYIRAGTYPVLPKLPYTPGTDAAGEIIQLGVGSVSQFKIGQRVYVIRPRGGMGAYASQVIAKAVDVFPLADNVSFTQGAALGVPYATAYRGLFDRAKVNAGEVVLIHGATGAVGLAAVQFAVHHGCVVFGTGSSDEGRKLVKSFGATEMFDHSADGYLEQIKKATPNGAGVNAILEMAAHHNLDHDLDLLAKNGRVVTIGSRARIEIDPRRTFVKEAAILGMSMWAGGEEAVYRADRAISAGVAEGWLKPVIAKEFPLSDAAAGHEEVLNGKVPGKIVLRVH